MADHQITILITLLLISLIPPLFSVQTYDGTPCTTTAPPLHGATYTCNSNTKTCNTYIVYRPKLNQPLSAIAALFNVNESQLQTATRFENREVVVPIVCDCPDRSSRAVVNYTNNDSNSFTDIACGVYQGLVKPFVVEEQNGNLHETALALVKVPIKCACVNTSHEINSVTNNTTYLVSYPVMENDTVPTIARKFGVTNESIEKANALGPRQTIFGGTTLLVPTTGAPVLNLDHLVTRPDPGPHDIIPVNGIVNRNNGFRLSVFLIVFSTLSLFGVVSLLVYLRRRRNKEPQLVLLTLSNFKCYTPDFLDDISKLKQSLASFSFDELKLATQDFSESLLIGKSVYKAQIARDFPVAIKEMFSTESANRVINILTTINHFNVVKLEGCCFYMNRSYLVFEFAKNGNLRDCLNDARRKKQLTWVKRVKIVADLAEGLHYIHYCTKPTYVHRNISSANVLITGDWRAKISGFDHASPVAEESGGDRAEVMTVNKKVCPGYLECDQNSRKLDVYNYGVVLMEILSGKVAEFGRKLLDRIEFLANVGVVGESLECLENFKMFMDANLEGEYGFGDALRLVLLAKWCVQDDPEIRPTMDDVLKTLSRMS